MSKRDYYEVLGVGKNASPDDSKASVQIDKIDAFCYYLGTSPRSGRKTQRGVFIGANK